ncbi:helix-turn-helix transcriptional regulator [Longispora sp. NPDC051575]|uniref:helix-turn-helix transcriptional regulator n=1 Tax=Longispora sp. NPDC051575 TaxID=3154943 RepID=UPI0034425489
MIGVLSRSLGLPARKVRTALDELNSVGAARPEQAATPTGPVRIWRGRQPDAVVTSLHERQVEAVRARHLLRQRLCGLDLASITHHADLDANDAVRPLSGVLRVRARIAELAPTVRTEQMTLNPEPVISAAAIKAGAHVGKAIAERGVKLLSIGVPAGVGDASRPHADVMTALGRKYRELPQLPTRIIIMDRRTAILPFDPAHQNKGAFEVTAPAVVDQLVGLFLQYWSRAQAPERPLTADLPLTTRERAIVALLASGMTDAATAAELGLSVRTIAYTLSDLMSRYGVQNRFQLGLVLGAQGAQPRVIQEEQQQ